MLWRGGSGGRGIGVECAFWVWVVDGGECVPGERKWENVRFENWRKNGENVILRCEIATIKRHRENRCLAALAVAQQETRG
jgi:hypothetical protein